MITTFFMRNFSRIFTSTFSRIFSSAVVFSKSSLIESLGIFLVPETEFCKIILGAVDEFSSGFSFAELKEF